MGKFKYVKKILNYYGKGEHKYFYPLRKSKTPISERAIRLQRKANELSQKAYKFEKAGNIKDARKLDKKAKELMRMKRALKSR